MLVSLSRTRLPSWAALGGPICAVDKPQADAWVGSQVFRDHRAIRMQVTEGGEVQRLLLAARRQLEGHELERGFPDRSTRRDAAKCSDLATHRNTIKLHRVVPEAGTRVVLANRGKTPYDRAATLRA